VGEGEEALQCGRLPALEAGRDPRAGVDDQRHPGVGGDARPGLEDDVARPALHLEEDGAVRAGVGAHAELEPVDLLARVGEVEIERRRVEVEAQDPVPAVAVGGVGVAHAEGPDRLAHAGGRGLVDEVLVLATLDLACGSHPRVSVFDTTQDARAIRLVGSRGRLEVVNSETAAP
jgi:hypothetical protein